MTKLYKKLSFLFLVFVTSLLTACSVQNQKIPTGATSIDGVKQETNASEEVSDLDKYGSLWKSDLFSEDRFKLNIKLTAKEQAEAKVLARSFEGHMEKAEVFMHFLLSELKKRDLPAELAALPMLESGFENKARSHAGALGPWQFIKSTGKSLGLKLSDDYNEFYDFIASTNASLNYLEHLYNELGDWDLAIAAYNQGEYAIKNAIKRTKSKGIKDINFNTVKLTAHANLYVRRFHAYADILKNPQNYKLQHPELANCPAFVYVPVAEVAPKISTLTKLAKISGTEVKTIKHLNAGFLKDTLDKTSDKYLILPKENGQKLEQLLGVNTIDPETVHSES